MVASTAVIAKERDAYGGDSNTNIQIMSPGVFGIVMRGCMLRSNWLGHLDWGYYYGP